MKNFALTTLAVVSLTILAQASAQAQTGYYGNGINWNATPQVYPASHYVLPPATPAYGTKCVNGQCANSCCVNGICTTGRCGNGTCANGTCTTGYRGTYRPSNGYGFGNMFGSWFGLRPRPSYTCTNGRCYPTQTGTPYGPSPYRSPGYAPAILPAGGMTHPYYGSY